MQDSNPCYECVCLCVCVWGGGSVEPPLLTAIFCCPSFGSLATSCFPGHMTGLLVDASVRRSDKLSTNFNWPLQQFVSFFVWSLFFVCPKCRFIIHVCVSLFDTSCRQTFPMSCMLECLLHACKEKLCLFTRVK
jgi:hypothetical protein